MIAGKAQPERRLALRGWGEEYVDIGKYVIEQTSTHCNAFKRVDEPFARRRETIADALGQRAANLFRVHLPLIRHGACAFEIIDNFPCHHEIGVLPWQFYFADKVARPLLVFDPRHPPLAG